MHSFSVSGMTCRHCVLAVTEAIRRVDPAATVAVDLAAGRVTVHDETAAPSRMAAAMAEEGYKVAPEPA